MSRLITYILLCLSLLLNSFQVSASENRLRIHGSNTVGAALIPELVNAWLQQKGYKIVSDRETAKEERLITASRSTGENLEVEIHAHGSSTSFRSLEAGDADLGMSSRPIKPEELEKLQFLGKLNEPDTEYIIAIDGLSVIVSRQSPVKELSREQLKKIFTGQIKNWKQLGYSDDEIDVYARDDNSGTYDTFKSLVIGKKNKLVATAKRYESNAKLSEDVSRDPNGIGFVGLAYVHNSRAIAVADKGATALLPTAFNVATEDYVLSRRLYLYLPSSNTHPLAQSLAEFARSANGQKIAERVGFVSQEVVSYKPVIHETAPEEYKKFVANADRLSLNIRFRKSSTVLDNKAVHDVNRLIAYMTKNENKDKKFLLFGFADSNEVLPYYSLSLSIDRADVVADKLLFNGMVPYRVRGYGQTLPVSSNEHEAGRIRNRRVEIWASEETWRAR